MKVEFISNGFCCDPNGPFPQEIGTLRVTHLGNPHRGDVDVNLGGFSGDVRTRSSTQPAATGIWPRRTSGTTGAGPQWYSAWS